MRARGSCAGNSSGRAADRWRRCRPLWRAVCTMSSSSGYLLIAAHCHLLSRLAPVTSAKLQPLVSLVESLVFLTLYLMTKFIFAAPLPPSPFWHVLDLTISVWRCLRLRHRPVSDFSMSYHQEGCCCLSRCRNTPDTPTKTRRCSTMWCCSRCWRWWPAPPSPPCSSCRPSCSP